MPLPTFLEHGYTRAGRDTRTRNIPVQKHLQVHLRPKIIVTFQVTSFNQETKICVCMHNHLIRRHMKIATYASLLQRVVDIRLRVSLVCVAGGQVCIHV